MQTKTLNRRCCVTATLFFVFAVQLFSQNTNTSTTNALKNKPRNAVKLFLEFKTFSYSKNFNTKYDSFNILSTYEQKLIGLYPSVAYTKYHKNGHFTEIALSFIQLQHNDDVNNLVYTNANTNVQSFVEPSKGEKSFDVKLGFRFDYNIPLFSGENSQIYLGFSDEPLIFYQKVLPYTSASFPATQFELRNNVALIPRFVTNVTKKVFLDFNIPLSLFSMSYRYENNKNPILPISEQQVSTFDARFLPKNWQFRLGLGVRI
jgi:hypothetical protein